MKNIKLKRNESFSIRDGWFDKAINAIANKEKPFYKNEGIYILGIGANMVKGLKYWLIAANVFDAKKNDLTDFGNLIYKYDRFLESKFTWYLIHYFLVTNFDDSPVFYSFFNSIKFSEFNKKDLLNCLNDLYSDCDYNSKSLESDISILLKSYVKSDIVSNPEENYSCPLSELNLLLYKNGLYIKNSSSFIELSSLIIYFSLSNIYSDSFDIIESTKCDKSPCNIFNLEKNLYYQYLEDLKNRGLITINKTAGLNIVYFNKNYTLSDLFKINFEGDHNEI